MHGQRVVTGTEAMIGASAEVIDDFEDVGWVRAFGEIWRAESPQPLSKGTEVVIANMDGLTLSVEPAAAQSVEPNAEPTAPAKTDQET